MRRVANHLVCLALAASAVGLLMVLLPKRPGRTGIATWNPARLLEAVAREQRRGEELDGAVAAAFGCCDAKHAVAREVVAGRMSLTDAAARFQELDAACSGPGVRLLRSSWPGASDE
jgi:hypothetical protein